MAIASPASPASDPPADVAASDSRRAVGWRRLVAFYGRYLRHELPWLAIALASMPVYGLASAGMVTLIGPLFADVLQAGPAVADPAGSGGVLPGVLDLKHWADRAYAALADAVGVREDTAVVFVPALLLGLFVVRNVADFVGSYAFQHIGFGVTTRVRNDLHARFLEQGQHFHRASPSGALLSRVVSDVAAMQSALSNRVFDIVQQSITLAALFLLLVSTHAGLTLFVVAAIPLFTWVFVGAGRRVRRASRRTQDRLADVARLLADTLRALPVVQAFGTEAFERRRFGEATARHLRVSLRVQRLSIVVPLLLETVLAGAAVVLLVYAGQAIRAGTLTAPLVLQFVANLWLLYDPVRKLNRANLSLQQAVAASDRVVALLDQPLEIAERPGAVPLTGFRDRISVDHVTVRFAGRTILDDVTFDIGRGEVVALVGPSGAGKTTTAGLLLRFLDPDAGAVRVDGRDLREFTLASVRALTGLVTQQTLLFDDTIRNNIAYGRDDLPEARIEAAAAVALVEPFVRLQPRGYDTRVGEGGAALSGGERQRLAIARALAKDPPVLILDEATSQLDAESERLVRRAMRNSMAGRTVLVIAHRAETVAEADRVVVLDGGRVVASGRPADLLGDDGVYRRLFGAGGDGEAGAQAGWRTPAAPPDPNGAVPGHARGEPARLQAMDAS